MRGRLVAATVFLAACLMAGSAWSQTRGLTIRLKTNEAAGAADAGAVELYKASYALVIGIDNYTAGWPRLSNAVKDAELVAAELRKRGFEVTLKTNLTSSELKSAFEEFFILKGQDPLARLFVWFAGHGHTIEDEGYLVPADAPPPETRGRFKLKALNMRRFGEYVREAESKHAYAVFDACFAGTIFTTQRSRPPAAITHATTMPVRQFLTSGDATQTVSDDGTFRKLFLRALRGEERADANRDGYVTGSEMGLFLSDRLTNLTRAGQTPRYGKLRDPDYDLGDFVFALAAPPPPRTFTPTSPPAPTGMTAEMLFWQSMKDSTNPDEFEEFLRQFPSDRFAGLARIRLAELRRKRETQTAALPPAESERALGLSRDERRDVQRALTVLGFNTGGADGILGRRSRDAIKAYQRARQVAASGHLDADLFKELMDEAKAPLARQEVEERQRLEEAEQRRRKAKERPAEARRKAEAEARRLAQEERQRAEEEARRQREAEARQEAAESEARGKAETELAVGVFPRKPGNVFKDCEVCPEMAVVPAGSFTMGSPPSEKGRDKDEGPEHQVTISRPLAVGRYEVTFAQWDACVAAGGCNGHRPDDEGWGRGKRPVIYVSWNRAKAYIAWLSRKTGKSYRLPSEAVWEFAARAGTTTPFHFGATSGPDQANYNGNYAYAGGATGVYRGTTVAVGSFPANAFGLHDMHGNVWEWVEDCWRGSYGGAPSDGTAWTAGGDCRQRVLRGGGWVSSPNNVRTANRFRDNTDYRNNSIGFRVARTLSR